MIGLPSPDLNSIEHLRDNLDQRVRHHPIPPSNLIQLRQALIQEWNNIPQAEINTLIRSVRPRCQAVPSRRRWSRPVFIWDFGERPLPHLLMDQPSAGQLHRKLKRERDLLHKSMGKERDVNVKFQPR